MSPPPPPQRKIYGVAVPPIPPDEVPPSTRREQPTLTDFPPAQPMPAPKLPRPAALPAQHSTPTPPGNVKFSGPGGVSFSGPGQIFLLAFLVAGVLAGVVYFVRGEVKTLGDKLEAVDDRAKARDEAMQRRLGELTSELQSARERDRHNLELMGAVMNRLGSNLRFEDGSRPTADFHPAPLSPRSAPVQPKDVLLAP